jgi:tape measure domain-containing protein
VAESGVAYVSVVPSAKGFGGKLAKDIDGQSVGESVGKQMSAGVLAQAADLAKKTTQVIGGAVAATAATVAGIAAGKGLSRLLQIEDAQAKLKGLGNSAEDVTAIMSNALDAVRGTAFGLGDAATVAASAVAAGIKPGQELTKYLSLTADAATIAGISLDEMGSILNKTTTAGKVYTDNLNQLADRGIPIFQWLQEEYGVSAEKLSEMVQKGEVDSATFRKVIEENIGGAALSAGDTTRGAFANMIASLGRVGANLLGGVFPAFKTVFTGITTALEPIETAAKNAGSAIGSVLAPKIESLASGLSNVLPSLTQVGPIVGPLAAILGAFAISGLGPLIGSIGPLAPLGAVLSGLSGPIALIAAAIGGLIAVSPSLQAALVYAAQSIGSAFTTMGGIIGPAISSLLPVINVLIATLGNTLAIAVVQLVPVIIQLGTALVSVLAPVLPVLIDLLGRLASAMVQLQPVIVTLVGIASDLLYALLPVAAVLGQALAQALAQALPLITQLTQFIADNLAVVATVAATYVAYRTISATIGIATAAQSAFTAASYGAAGASYASATATKAQAAAAGIATAAQNVMKSALVSSVVAWNASNVAVLRNSSLTVGTKAALLASSIATGVATAAQWAWNAAMTANPIGIIIVAIGALVAAIIWIATQTTFFQDLWKVMTEAIGAAWTWLMGVLQPVFDFIGAAITAIGAVFTWLWLNILQPYINAWVAIIQFLWGILQPIFNLIGSIIAIVGAAFMKLYEFYVQTAINAIAYIVNWLWTNVIQPVVGFISGGINTLGNAFAFLYGNYVKPALDNVGRAFKIIYDNIIKPVVDNISTALNILGSAVGTVFGTMGSTIKNAFNGVVSFVKGVFNGIIDAVNGVIGNISGVVKGVGGALGIDVGISKIPRLAEGGIVSKQPGGILANIGEGRYDEAVVPLSPRNLSLLESAPAAGQMPSQLVLVDADNVLLGTFQVAANQTLDAYSRARKTTLTNGMRRA